MSGTGTANIPTKVKLTDERSLSNDEFAEQLLGEGKPVLIGGLSLIGRGGSIVYAISILQATSVGEDGTIEHLKGWCFFKGHPKLFGRNGFHYLDSAKGKLTALALPNTMTYVVAEVDSSLVEKEADKRELKEVINWSLPQISDG